MPQPRYAGWLPLVVCSTLHLRPAALFFLSGFGALQEAALELPCKLQQVDYHSYISPSLIFFQEYHLFSHQPHQLSLIESCLIQAAVLASHCSLDKESQAFFQMPCFLLSSVQSQVSAGEQGWDPNPGCLSKTRAKMPACSFRAPSANLFVLAQPQRVMWNMEWP